MARNKSTRVWFVSSPPGRGFCASIGELLGLIRSSAGAGCNVDDSLAPDECCGGNAKKTAIKKST